MNTRIKLIQDVMFLAESGTGHTVVMDGAPDAGGRNLGPRPMEMLLIGLGGCSAFDVVTILRRSREAITDCVCEIEAERATTDPKVFTRIVLNYTLTGRNLDAHKVERAIKLSEEKYCSASIMLGKTAVIEHTFKIVADAT